MVADVGPRARDLDFIHLGAGVNRVWWNLRYDAIKPAGDYVPWQGGGFRGPLAVPGRYIVRVTADGRVASGSVMVRKDPRSPASLAAMREQLAFLLRVRRDLASLTSVIVHLRARAAGMPAKADAVNGLLHAIYNPEVTQGEDALRYPERVYGRLSALASDVAAADAAPTQSEYAVLRVLEQRAKVLTARAGAM